jgi:hypothetical protein
MVGELIHVDFEGESAPLTEFERQVIEAQAAVTLVAEGHARSVSIAGLSYADEVAATILPSAHLANVAIRVEHLESGSACLIVGPRLSAP